MKPKPTATHDVRPHELLNSDELLARFGDRAGKHGPNAVIKKPFMVRIPRDNALAWHLLARRLGTRPATLMAELLVVASTVSPDAWHGAVAALQRGSKTSIASPGSPGWAA